MNICDLRILAGKIERELPVYGIVSIDMSSVRGTSYAVVDKGFPSGAVPSPKGILTYYSGYCLLKTA